MKKTNNNAPMKRIAASATMLAVSAAMLGTSTYAWFTMNKEVTVTGLQTTAKAEEGIVIAAYTNHGATAPSGDSAYSNTAASYDVPITLLPTFTNDTDTWYHAWSTMITNGQAYGSEGYKEVTNGTADFVALDNTKDYYYLVNKFNIKSVTAAKNVYVKDIQVTGGGTEAYDASMRIAIKSGSTVQFFKKDGSSWTETAAATVAPDDDINSDVTVTGTVLNTSIPSILTATTTGTDVLIYVYYDGEDAACKSENATFDNTTLTVIFTSDQSAVAHSSTDVKLGTYTVTRSGSAGSYTYAYSKADGATFPTSGSYTYSLNGGTATNYASFLTALESADFTAPVTVTVAASA